MREIKFRAWHTTQKKMFPAKELGADQLTLSADGRGFVNCAPTLAGSVFFGEAIIPLQYTGLKDSRGKEIYEGDIVILSNIPTDGDRKICKAIMDNWQSVFESVEVEDGFYCTMGNTSQNDREVIGNIYENPELLKEN